MAYTTHHGPEGGANRPVPNEEEMGSFYYQGPLTGEPEEVAGNTPSLPEELPNDPVSDLPGGEESNFNIDSSGAHYEGSLTGDTGDDPIGDLPGGDVSDPASNSISHSYYEGSLTGGSGANPVNDLPGGGESDSATSNTGYYQGSLTGEPVKEVAADPVGGEVTSESMHSNEVIAHHDALIEKVEGLEHVGGDIASHMLMNGVVDNSIPGLKLEMLNGMEVKDMLFENPIEYYAKAIGEQYHEYYTDKTVFYNERLAENSHGKEKDA